MCCWKIKQKKIIKQKQEKNSIQSKNWKKSWFPSCVDIWKIEKELNPGKKIYYIPLPYHDDDIRYDNIAIFLHYVKMKYTTIQWVLCCCTRKFIVSSQSLHITFVSTPMYSFLHFILYISVREILSIRIIISQQFRSYFPSRVNILCL